MAQATKNREKPERRSNTREKLIDAALEVVTEQGARRFSLDAVAERAGVSKGGLLYNFPTKVDLMKAMVARHVEGFSRQFEDAKAHMEKDGRPNALIRAYLTTFRDHFCSKGGPPSGFLAAIAEEPVLLDPVREKNAAFFEELKRTSDDCELATIAFLTVEGIRHVRLFATNPLTDPELAASLDGLLERLAK